ncbi:MAG: hypothetical protein ACYCYF_02625 [Anaerolineae bacterium]
MDRTQGSRYQAYMLRLWRAGNGPDAPWRASTECAVTGARTRFESLEKLFAFLLRETESAGAEPARDAERAQGSVHLPRGARE